MPHMHFRGKDMTYMLEYPDGRKHTILSVPHYDFNWQLDYNVSIKAPKGSVMHVYAHFDNSVNNKFNPNPKRTVYYVTMTWEGASTAGTSFAASTCKSVAVDDWRKDSTNLT
jgi:hypothetical protein